MGKKKWTGPNERKRHNKHKGGHQKRQSHLKHGQNDEGKKIPFVRHDNKFKGNNTRDRLSIR